MRGALSSPPHFNCDCPQSPITSRSAPIRTFPQRYVTFGLNSPQKKPLSFLIFPPSLLPPTSQVFLLVFINSSLAQSSIVTMSNLGPQLSPPTGPFPRNELCALMCTLASRGTLATFNGERWARRFMTLWVCRRVLSFHPFLNFFSF
jgi:hypothetical protein